MTFDAGSTAGTTTTFTSEKIFVAPGSYTLSENDVAGYAEGLWSCSAGTLNNDAFDSGELTLAFGESAVCTIVNNDVAPTLTLAKVVVNDNGGSLAAADFGLSIDGALVADSTAQTVVANTDIEISETIDPGYTEGAWACVDSSGLTSALPTAGAAAGETIQLSPGATVTCEISNDDIAPTLTLVKTVSNDDGGLLSVADFDISIDAVEVPTGAEQTVLANTDIVISELDIPGYAEGSWSCSDANAQTATLPNAGVATGTTVNLAPGSAVVCEIVNDDIPATLTLVKNLTNDDGGDLTVADFGLSVDGTVVPDLSLIHI